MAQAFAKFAHHHNDIWLAVVGMDEAGIGNDFARLCGSALSRVRRIDYMETTAHAMVSADVLVLPSYREGFGSVVIEAAACGVPAIASRIYGLTDSIEENVTGLLHPPGDIAALHECMQRLCVDSELRLKMGAAACRRVQLDFSMEAVTAAFVAYYEKFLGH